MKTEAQLRREAAIAVIESAARKYGSTFITRDQISEFTGGAFSPRYMANLDCRKEGVGVPNSFKVGRRKCYPIDSLCEWLISRLEV
jgi:hypothetical protein